MPTRKTPLSFFHGWLLAPSMPAPMPRQHGKLHLSSLINDHFLFLFLFLQKQRTNQQQATRIHNATVRFPRGLVVKTKSTDIIKE
jgi:hypothetical protein